MPAHNRDRKVREEAQSFCESRSSYYPRPCLHHLPTLEELQSTNFSDFVRNVVLRKAELGYDDRGEENDHKNLAKKTPIHYLHGMAKVTLPKGFCDHVEIAKDETGRGPGWDEGTKLGDMILPSPIKQCVRGIGGIYEFTFLDQKPITLADFRKKADEYLKSQLGNETELSIELLERKFWKRLGPTMPPSMYGADMEGTLFGEDDCYGWNISKLQSCLQLLLSDQPDNDKGGIPGVTTSYLYFGMWASVFCAHKEDMNLLSINYLHAGAPKVWYAVAAGEDAKRMEQFCEGHYHEARAACPEYLRHKRSLLSPAVLKKAGIPFTKTVQYPGDAVITFPGSYHFGFNTGFNVAEATNFSVPEWLPYGKLANVCLCRPDSVRIDMCRFGRLLLQYEKDVTQAKPLTWKDWAVRLAEKKKSLEEKSNVTDVEIKNGAKSKRQEFWVEVVKPLSAKSKKAKTTLKKKSRKRSQTKEQEVWHLAKSGGRKSLRPAVKVLCIVSVDPDGERNIDSEEIEDEQCFSGIITEVRDDHVRIRFDGLSKKEDSWISIESPKLFLDGGRWGDTLAEEDLPPMHYWHEGDSKRLCV